MAIKIGTNKKNKLNGTNGNDTLIGLGGNDTLLGKNGNDRLLGGSGNDTLDGGKGRDKMAGGTGDDTYVVDNAGDRVTELAGQGNDTVKSSITFVLGANFENLTLTGSAAINGALSSQANDIGFTLTGNAAANILTGGLGHDVLVGGGGADNMNGGAGNDTYFVDTLGSTVTEFAGQGFDTVNSSVSFNLGANVENLTLTGSSAIDGVLSSQANDIGFTLTGNSASNELTGGFGHDVLVGGGGLDVLFGSIGNDSLFGEGGADILNGGQGIDTFFYSSISDTPSGPSQRDAIVDFQQGQDKIDLTRIDAGLNLAGDQAFFFVFTGNFGANGDLTAYVRYSQVNGNTLIQGDLGGDGNFQTDFEILLLGLFNLDDPDFIL